MFHIYPANLWTEFCEINKVSYRLVLNLLASVRARIEKVSVCMQCLTNTKNVCCVLVRADLRSSSLWKNSVPMTKPNQFACEHLLNAYRFTSVLHSRDDTQHQHRTRYKSQNAVFHVHQPVPGIIYPSHYQSIYLWLRTNSTRQTRLLSSLRTTFASRTIGLRPDNLSPHAFWLIFFFFFSFDSVR